MSDELYREEILDHYRNPQYSGELLGAQYSGTADNPLCGDVITVQLKVDNGRIADIRFHGKGCALSRASADMMAEALQGTLFGAIAALREEDILRTVPITPNPARLKCVLLILNALRALQKVGTSNA